mmetsp:Transcript_14051/g.52716  ORF Transcript_14051/g.52716 Transcript_14051/m.52716 type:complete len:208 (+) Transcript_14051:930-1553(+)
MSFAMLSSKSSSSSSPRLFLRRSARRLLRAIFLCFSWISRCFCRSAISSRLCCSSCWLRCARKISQSCKGSTVMRPSLSSLEAESSSTLAGFWILNTKNWPLKWPWAFGRPTNCRASGPRCGALATASGVSRTSHTSCLRYEATPRACQRGFSSSASSSLTSSRMRRISSGLRQERKRGSLSNSARITPPLRLAPSCVCPPSPRCKV